MDSLKLWGSRSVLSVAIAILLGHATLSGAQDAATQTAAADWWLQWYKDRLDVLIPEHLANLDDGLSTAAKKVTAETRFAAIKTPTVNAVARRDESGRRTVVFGSGLLAAVDNVSTALAVASAYGRSECLSGFIEVMGPGLADNTEKARQGLPVRLLPSFVLYSSQNAGTCGVWSLDRLKADGKVTALREAFIAGTVQFVLAHEIGHHVLGHVDDPLRKPRTDGERVAMTETSRRRETAADAFAFRTMAGAHIVPVTAIPLVMLFASSEGFDIECESESTHPAGIHRMAAMMKAADSETENPEFKKYLADAGQLPRWNAYMAQMKELIRQAEAENGASHPH